MNKNLNQNECQFVSLQSIAYGYDRTPQRTLRTCLNIFVRRHLSSRWERIFYKHADDFINRFSMKVGKNISYDNQVIGVQTAHLKTGDMVRVRSKEEIESTLNNFRRMKGCAFMEDEMTPYCGTVQRVLKSMDRFVDERELRVKKCKGLVLLEGVMCQGTTAYGRCDRSCFLFWREEWLEKI